MLREAYYIRFNAMVEYADKTKMIAGFGQYLVDLLDLQPSTTSAATTPAATSPTATMTRQLGTEMDDDMGRAPYTSASQAQLITDDCLLALEQWIPAEQDERPTITAQLDDDDDREIAHDAALLTDLDIDTHHQERQQLQQQQQQQQQQVQEEQEKGSASTAPMPDDAPDAPALPLSMPPPAYTPRPGAMGDEVRDEKFVAALPTPNEPLIDYFQLFDEKGSQIASFDAHADRRRSYAEFAHLYLPDESKKKDSKMNS
ncbi:hypothetical protein BC940DRAFT_121004 [Gongronella butleri]|nr:hypothetical protein BC940DRAFT_121004 [Gongronella butleri]